MIENAMTSHLISSLTGVGLDVGDAVVGGGGGPVVRQNSGLRLASLVKMIAH